MNDNHPDVIEVNLGGKPRLLKYPINAFTVAQIRYKVRVTVGMIDDPSVGDIPVFVWVGLLQDYPRLQLDTVGKWIEEDEEFDRMGTLQQMISVVAKVLQKGSKQTDEVEREEDEDGGSLEEMLAPLE